MVILHGAPPYVQMEIEIKAGKLGSSRLPRPISFHFTVHQDGSVSIPLLQMRKLRLREVQDYTSVTQHASGRTRSPIFAMRLGQLPQLGQRSSPSVCRVSCQLGTRYKRLLQIIR